MVLKSAYLTQRALVLYFRQTLRLIVDVLTRTTISIAQKKLVNPVRKNSVIVFDVTKVNALVSTIAQVH